MENRLHKFRSLKNHAMLKKSYAKLTDKDINFCECFIKLNCSLSNNDYASKVVRIFMDNPNKTKIWKEIEELLICSIC